MLPPPGASDITMSAPDAFDVPVFVRRSSPLNPAKGPSRTEVEKAQQPWPTSSNIPPDGDYLVTTTWRALLDATTTVGRDITPWLAAVPRLARREIMARRYPLSAYLVRDSVQTDQEAQPRWKVIPSAVYSHGTESSTRTAFGYHIGMTMAEWACGTLMGLGPTTHAESAAPPGAAPDWEKTSSLPDLFGTHPADSEVWLVEAKGGRWLRTPSRVKGAKQLDVRALLPVPHHKVLCGTSLEKRLFMMIDVENVDHGGDNDGAGTDDQAQDSGEVLLELARARMITYFTLASLPPALLRVTPVGRPEAGQGLQRSDALRLLERDSATDDLRRRVGGSAGEGTIRNQDGLDMLTSRIPGTDLVLGMSRRLYSACRELAGLERRTADEVRRMRPEYTPYISGLPLTPDVGSLESPLHRITGDGDRQVSDTRYERQAAEARSLVQHLRTEQRSDYLAAARRGFAAGDERTWEQLIDLSPEPAIPGQDGYLEAATTDTYLAVEETALDLEEG
ncbi:hypothetical protein ACFXC8_22710 [Streptomyces sp. NPDC059441]|uniref:hypothetical protein n=1 Tax=Streptomyces sp. NPDC059441 TaxID=3346829 RepID=UPI00369B5007